MDPFRDPVAATVLAFASPHCPISNRYAPELRRLHQQYSPRGVAFFLVYADAGAPVGLLDGHVRDYRYPFRAVRDPMHTLVKASGATTTPEVAVFRPGARLVYHGRIDDRFADFGKERAQPTRRDLETTLDAVLEGRPPPVAVTPTVGCAIE